MCGIAGFLTSQPVAGVPALLRAMGEAIAARGPDDADTWNDDQAGIGLSHRRLAVVDLTAAGHQPMASPGGRYVLIFNGEVYNHAELRAQLSARDPSAVWRGHSDTETLLAGIEAWGLEDTLGRAVGMFAFALWDKAQRVLTLCRDRLGEKPMYYGWQGGTFLFGSDLKALRVHPAFSAEVDRGALVLFMRHNYVPAPYSIYRGISKLPPGCLLRVSLGSRDAPPQPYWSAVAAAVEGVRRPFEGTAGEAVSQLDGLLRASIGQQMLADVPVGAFLSGGIDSSTVVALMQAVSPRPVKTFSIGFNEAAYNEAEHAKAVARHLGTDHTELYVTPQEAMAVIPGLPAMYAEPFADSSQIPTYLVSALARREATVSLSGDAGDELFAGYNRYTFASKAWRRISALPAPLRSGLARAVLGVSPGAWNRLPFASRFGNLGDKAHKAAGVLASSTVDELYRGLVSHWPRPQDVVTGGVEPPTMLHGAVPQLDGLGDVERMMALDLVSYLPDDILAKVDRAAMAVSLETRVPFLDHRVVEFAWRLPMSLKLRAGQSKWVLRQVLAAYVPRALVERPKMGFGVPIDAWLRGPLRDWAEDLLDESRMRGEGFFEPGPIRQKWAEHLSGRRNWQYPLWNALMFQAWLRETRP